MRCVLSEMLPACGTSHRLSAGAFLQLTANSNSGLTLMHAMLQIIAAAKKRGQEKAKLTKSMIVMDVKPWDDTTGIAAACMHQHIQSALPDMQ